MRSHAPVKLKLWHLFLVIGYLSFSLALLTAGLEKQHLVVGVILLLTACLIVVLTIVLRKPRRSTRQRISRKHFDAMLVSPILGLLVGFGIFFLNPYMFLEPILFGILVTCSMVFMVYSSPPPIEPRRHSDRSEP